MAEVLSARRWAWFVGPALLLICSGCQNGSAGPERPAEQMPAGNRTPLPDAERLAPSKRPGLEELVSVIPAPPADSAPRGPHWSDAAVLRSGSEACAFAPSAGLDPLAGTITLTSFNDLPGQALCWAMYRFDDLSADALPAQIEVRLQDALPASYYIGVSDYAKKNWKWTSIHTPSGIDSATANGRDVVSPYGHLYCVVAVYAGERLTIASLSLRTQLDLPPPQDFAATVNCPDAVRLSWTDPALSFDPDGTGPAVFHYDIVWIERADTPSGPWTVLSGLYSHETELWLDGSGGLVLPDYSKATYFRARIATTKAFGPPGNAVPGIRQFEALTGVSATDGSLYDRVHISWPSVPYATSYGVYIGPADDPDVASGLLAETTATSYGQMVSSTNSTPEIDSAYTYWIVAISALGTQSPPSASDTGYRSLPIPQNLQASDGSSPDSITVSWDPLPGTTNYRIDYGIEPYESGLSYAVKGANQFTLELGSWVDEQTTFTFRVAVDIGLDSRYLLFSMPDTGYVGN